MVQLTPVTKFHSGSGYQYEDTVIYGFAHTSKGHWNLCHIPLLPVTGTVTPDDYSSGYSHENESAHPGYYQVYLERYDINTELTSTLRCAFHKYTFKPGVSKKLVANLLMSNEKVRDWAIQREGENVFTGFQETASLAPRPMSPVPFYFHFLVFTFTFSVSLENPIHKLYGK